MTGTLTITFDDDAPTATDEASQNVAEGATVTGTLDFVAGADGATVTQINGTALVFNPADADYSQAIDIGDGSIKVKADGTYSFTADPSVIGAGSASGDLHGDGRRWRHGDGDDRLRGDRRQRAERRHGFGGGRRRRADRRQCGEHDAI